MGNLVFSRINIFGLNMTFRRDVKWYDILQTPHQPISTLHYWCDCLRDGLCCTSVSWYLLKFGGCKSMSHIVSKWFPTVLSIESSKFVQRCLFYNYISMIWELGVFTTIVCSSMQIVILMTNGLNYIMTSLFCIKHDVWKFRFKIPWASIWSTFSYLWREKTPGKARNVYSAAAHFHVMVSSLTILKQDIKRGAYIFHLYFLHRSCNTWISYQFRLPTLEKP